MGRDIQAIKISGEDRRKYRDKVRRSLDAFARMLRERLFDENPSTVGQEIELNLTDERGMPSMRNADVLDGDRQPGLGHRGRAVQPGDQRAAPDARRRRAGHPGDRAPRRPQRGRHQGPHRGWPPGHGRHPAHAGRARRARGRHVGQRALQGAERADLRRPRRGHADRDRRRRAAAGLLRQHHPRGRLHQRAAAHPGQPGRVRQLLERGPGHRGRAGGAGGELPVPVRPEALARDQDHAVRAGHRHPLGRAEGAGRAAPGVVRRALDHLGVRPVRGEPQVLPRAAADLRGGGPAGRAGPGRGHLSSPR